MKVIVEGLATEYQDQGHGPVVLMLHGWGNTHHVFDGIVPTVAKNRRVVRLDLPGFGSTERPHHAWDTEAYARFVGAFCVKLKLNVDAVIGYSLGGRILIKGLSSGMISAHRCVLIAAAGLAERKTARNQAYGAVAKIGKLLLRVFPKSVQEKARRLLYAHTGSDYLTIASMSETFKRIVQEDLSANATGIAIPTCIIFGEHDLITTPAEGKKLHSLIRESRLEILPRASHFILDEQPAEVSRIVMEFI